MNVTIDFEAFSVIDKLIALFKTVFDKIKALVG